MSKYKVKKVGIKVLPWGGKGLPTMTGKAAGTILGSAKDRGSSLRAKMKKLKNRWGKN